MGSRKYTFYVDDKYKPLQVLLDKISAERKLSQTLLPLLTNGLLKEAEEMTKIAKAKAKEMEKTEKMYRQLREQLKQQEEEIFEQFKQHRVGATRTENLEWLKKKAERIGKTPEELLASFEERVFKNNEGGEEG